MTREKEYIRLAVKQWLLYSQQRLLRGRSEREG